MCISPGVCEGPCLQFPNALYIHSSIYIYALVSCLNMYIYMYIYIYMCVSVPTYVDIVLLCIFCYTGS